MKRINTISIGIASLLLLIPVLFGIVRAQGEAQPSDPAAYYKAKCVACQGPHKVSDPGCPTYRQKLRELYPRNV